MTERIALFPLGTVLFPGLVLPLHLFEERYRLLVADLLDAPEPSEPRGFGVVNIELGHEVGNDAARRLSGVGCFAELHDTTRHPDGRYDIVTVGTRRFRLKEQDRSRPYLQGEVEFLPEEPGGDPEPAAGHVRWLFDRYLARLRAAGTGAEEIDLPADPVRLSYLIASSMILDGHDKQRLLECEDAALRLRAERDLLIRENRVLDALPALPAGQFLDGSFHPN